MTDAEIAKYLRIVSEAMHIRRHRELFLWLSGELQQFLPHQILISAWGDFARWKVNLDVVSGLPGVRTAALAECSIDAVVREAHAQWMAAGRRPLLLSAGERLLPRADCRCGIHGALRTMRSLLVHGVYDERGGYDSLYIAMNTGSFTRGGSHERFLSLVDTLVAQIDAACRKVPALSVPAASNAPAPGPASGLHLSSREHEILDLVCRGSTNVDIAIALDISPFTVKNHVQRIFRKIGVSNRTQAAARYNATVRRSTESAV
jgi:transcriptional regulator EpsA